MLRRQLGALALAAAVGCALAHGAAAQDYPTRPITLIVPFPAGGGVDVIGRIVAEKLTASLGQQVIVDNRGGAAGVIGTRVAKAAAPDGYTLVMATSGSIAINPTLYANPGYEPRKDLAPIGLISSTPIVLMAHPSAPQQTLADVIAFAKANPGKLDIGTPPPGTSAYLGAELLKSMAGDRFHHRDLQGHRPAHHRSDRRARQARAQRAGAGAEQPAIRKACVRWRCSARSARRCCRRCRPPPRRACRASSPG